MDYDSNVAIPEEASSSESAFSARRVIKRYANRKLYDTQESRYVTLPQIAEFVRGGEDVQVVDNTTKEDLTAVTFAQIIYYEEEKKGASGDKRDAAAGPLRALIQQGSEKLVASLKERGVGRFAEDVHRVVDESMRALVASAISPVHQMQAEVKRLAHRIEELESRLKSVASGGPKKTPEAE